MDEQFENLRETFEEVSKKTKNYKELETVEDWPDQNSGLLNGSYNDLEDKLKSSYNSSFSGLFPEEFKDLKQYLESRLASKKGVIGIELGGRGSKLFSEFSTGFIKRSLGVVLHDNRMEEERTQDTQRNHKVLSENLFSPKGKQATTNWLNGKKADLVFEKMEGAHFPPEPGFMLTVFNRWYRLLSEEGIMLIQTSPMHVSSLEQVEQYLDTLEDKDLTIKYKRKKVIIKIRQGGVMAYGGRLHIILEKKEGAPESLL